MKRECLLIVMLLAVLSGCSGVDDAPVVSFQMPLLANLGSTAKRTGPTRFIVPECKAVRITWTYAQGFQQRPNVVALTAYGVVDIPVGADEIVLDAAAIRRMDTGNEYLVFGGFKNGDRHRILIGHVIEVQANAGEIDVYADIELHVKDHPGQRPLDSVQ